MIYYFKISFEIITKTSHMEKSDDNDASRAMYKKKKKIRGVL